MPLHAQGLSNYSNPIPSSSAGLFGHAPEKSILRAIVEDMPDPKLNKHDAHWQPLHDYVIPNWCTGESYVDGQVGTFAMIGFLAFMHIYNLRLGPKPLSPFLFQLLLDGDTSYMYNNRFFKQMSPTIATDAGTRAQA